jgi:hypothetical protein
VSSAGTNKKKQEKKDKEKENNPRIKVETIFYYEYPDDQGLYDKLERIVCSPALYDDLLNKTIQRRSRSLVGN